MEQDLSALRVKNCKPRTLHPMKIFFHNEECGLIYTSTVKTGFGILFYNEETWYQMKTQIFTKEEERQE